MGTGGGRDFWLQEVGEAFGYRRWERRLGTGGGRDLWVQEVGETFEYMRWERNVNIGGVRDFRNTKLNYDINRDIK